MQINEATKQDIVNEMDAAGEARLYQAMRHFWHPVMYASELGDAPKQVFLCDEQLVLVRLGGQIRCFSDLCVHRGTALSLGRVEGDEIRCAYHGWTYGSDGVCTSIPARFGTNIPKRARLKPYLAAEASGFIWVCLEDEPRLPVPEFPIYGDAKYRIIEVEPYEWGTSTHRRIENYVDVSHFAWVHDGVLGDHNKPEIKDHDVTRTETEISFEYPDQVEPPDIGKNQGLETDETNSVKGVLRYRLFLPGTAIIEQTLPGEHYYALFFGTSPLSSKKTRCFTLMARDYMLDDLQAGDRTMREYNDLVIGQDQPVVESQRPEQLPYDLSAELHIRGVDRVSLEYRKALVELTNELVA